jgi:hypothetical protein
VICQIWFDKECHCEQSVAIYLFYGLLRFTRSDGTRTKRDSETSSE